MKGVSEGGWGSLLSERWEGDGLPPELGKAPTRLALQCVHPSEIFGIISK